MAANIDKIDKALQMYYEQLNQTYLDDAGIGKFNAFCDENGFEEDDINTEMEMENAEDCVLVDFDETFPFDPPIDNEDERIQKLFEILKYCYQNGKPPSNEDAKPLRQYSNPNDIDVENVSDEIINEAKSIYKHQLYYSLGDKGIKENDLMYFLAVGYANNGYPFLTNVVDSFTRDRLVQKYEKKDENGFAFTTAKWVKNNPYTKDLAKRSKRLVNKLESGVKAYCNRISPKIQFTHLYKIDDSLKEISEYILATIQFIHKLLHINIHTQTDIPVAPFQLDLLIAVKNVIDDTHTTKPDSNEDDTEDDNDDDDDADDDDTEDDEEKDNNEIGDIDVDWIGNVKSKLDHEKCINTDPVAYKVAHKLNDKDDKISGPRMRFIDGVYNKFKNKLSERNLNKYNDNDNDDDNDDEKKYNDNEIDADDFKPKQRQCFDAKTYPQNKRFCVFVDRRAEKKCRHDEIAIFEPPYVADTIPSQHVAEWYFESVRQCLIPRKGFKDGKNERKIINLANDQNANKTAKESITLTSLTSVAGKLITFSFHVEAQDEIKCYLYFNGQTQRFYPQDIIQILPFIFEAEKDGDKYRNKAFINDGGAEAIIKQMQITDEKFEQFYNKIKTNKQTFPQTKFKKS